MAKSLNFFQRSLGSGGVLADFGSIASVGYYEMANRMVIKIRQLIVSANKVTTPYFSKLNETNKDGGNFSRRERQLVLEKHLGRGRRRTETQYALLAPQQEVLFKLFSQQ